MAKDNLDEQLSEEVTERFKQQVEALTPAERKLAKQLIESHELPKEPEPDYANMNNSDFAAALAKHGVR